MNKKTLLHIIQGAAVGIGAILPSISGGLLCVAFGLYEPLMELLTSPRKALKNNWRMFVPFGLGWVMGFILLARVCERFFSLLPNIAIMLFFGLIFGTLPNIFKDSEIKGKNASWCPFVISVAASYVFFHIIEAGKTISLPVNFWSFVLCGVLWGLSMIVPGLSSSTLLIYLGLYVPLADGIAMLDLNVLVPMGIGIAITVITLARVVNLLIKRHYGTMTRVILGFVIASSLKTIPNQFSGSCDLTISLVCCAVGFVLAVLMEIASKKWSK
jgi:putative membrane protein